MVCFPPDYCGTGEIETNKNGKEERERKERKCASGLMKIELVNRDNKWENGNFRAIKQ